ncbi:MAG: methyltransferase domain-containing protein [Methyloligellaceae bacterium]
MSETLFDKALLSARRTRAAGKAEAHDFLLRRVSDDFAERLAAVKRDFPRTLCLGAHHGVVARMLHALPGVGRVISADPCTAMLARAPAPRVCCDEEMLPFARASLDLAVSGLSLHFANDLPGALVQIRRALRPDGLFLAALAGGATLQELRLCLTQAESECEGGAAPRVSPTADIRDCGALLQRAGFALPVADSDLVEVTYANAFELMQDLRGMGATNVLTARSRKPLRRATLLRAAALYAERFPAPGGRIRATFEIIHLSGWAPDASQPRPLRPGSATARLADALGTTERSAGEKAQPAGGGAERPRGKPED